MIWPDDDKYGPPLAQADARRIPIRDNSIQMCVTSPPYWGLRDYGTGRWEGGDDPACDHIAGAGGNLANSIHSTRGGAKKMPDAQAIPYRDICGKCGARRVDHQIGLEPTIDEFVANMVRVFREVRRVLHPSGIAFVNLGDTYNSSPSGFAGTDHAFGHNSSHRGAKGYGRQERNCPGLKPKDLCMIPARVAIALCDDGWYLRADFIWNKPSPMPESVTDRPTKSHEYVFLLAKSERYYYDAHAVREDAKYGRRECSGPARSDRKAQSTSIWRGVGSATEQIERRSGTVSGSNPEAGRNMRSVLNVPSESYPGSHYATYPRKLIEPFIKAGSSERGCCPRCRSPWVRVVERETLRERVAIAGNERHGPKADSGCRQGLPSLGNNHGDMPQGPRVKTLGWRPTCKCYGTPPFPEYPPEPDPDSDPDEKERHRLRCYDIAWERYTLLEKWQPLPTIPAIILDPFIGSGTSIVVAQALGRHAIGLDLSREYLTRDARRRIEHPHSRAVRPERDERDEPHPLFDQPTAGPR